MKWKERKQRHDDAHFPIAGKGKRATTRKVKKPSLWFIERSYIDPLKTELLKQYGYEDWNMTDLTKDERFILDWLAKDDGQYGEAKCKALDSLMVKGLAEWKRRDARGDDYGYVGLTDKGVDLFRAERLSP